MQVLQEFEPGTSGTGTFSKRYLFLWEQINLPWLQQAISRGDDILLVTESPFTGSYFFQNEMDELIRNGYKRVGNYMKKVD